MALLGELGVVQRRIRRLEVATAVLPVGVQEQRIEPPVEIVVVGDVLPCAGARVELLQVAHEVAQPPPRFGKARHDFRLVHHDGEHIGNRAVLDHESAVHPGFAEGKFRIEQNPPRRAGGGEACRDRLARAVPASERHAARRGECQIAAADEITENETQQTIHRSTNGAAGRHGRADPSTGLFCTGSKR